MRNRLPIALSLTALFVAILGNTPFGEAAYNAIVPKNSVGTPQLRHNAVTGSKLAPNAVRAGHVADGTLLVSDFKAGQIPQGPKGDTGAKGDRGPSGFVRSVTSEGLTNPIATPTATYQSVHSLPLTAGKYIVFASAHIGQGGKPQYSGFCRLAAGGDTDTAGVQGANNAPAGGTNVGSGSNVFLTVIHEFKAADKADVLCWSPAAAATTVGDVRITALEVTST
jgi:hypothetical protein